MKYKYLKLFFLLICFYSFNIFGISNYIKTNFIENNNFRYLLDTKVNFDKSTRPNKEDLKSIENCENSDYKYFLEYITGHNVTFDKDIDTERAVSLYNIYIIKKKNFFYRIHLLE